MAAPILHNLVLALWLAWLIYWMVEARNAKRIREREHPLWLALHTFLLAIAGLLYGAPRLFPAPLQQRFLPEGAIVAGFGAALVIVGLAIAVWARRHLGANWSGYAALKEEHTLIRSGPYRAIRHPIYTGLLLALLGTAVASGTWRALLGFALALIVFLHRIRLEEALMTATFPQEYGRYRGESWALLPPFF
jgi:protein-S-isoprenylcysteine O-methyltransferase Ste14